jgi:hypothetical protein
MRLIKTLFIASSFIAFNVKAQVKLGVQGGLNLSSPSVSGLADKNNASKPFFGVVAQFNMGGLYFRPSLNYLQNQVETVTSTVIPANPNILGSIASTQTTTLTRSVQNFEIPLDLVFPFKLKKGKLLLSVAPTLTVGFKAAQSGTVNITPQVTGGSPTATVVGNTNVNFGNNPLEIKKVDWGTRFGLGYQFSNGVQLNAAYKLGLTNTSNSSQNFKQHNVILTAAWFLFNK